MQSSVLLDPNDAEIAVSLESLGVNGSALASNSCFTTCRW